MAKKQEKPVADNETGKITVKGKKENMNEKVKIFSCYPHKKF